MYHILDNADFYLGAQYMPLGNASFNNGGRQAELKLGGQVYVSLASTGRFETRTAVAGRARRFLIKTRLPIPFQMIISALFEILMSVKFA